MYKGTDRLMKLLQKLIDNDYQCQLNYKFYF